MRSFFSVQRSTKLLRDPEFFLAPAKYYARDFASTSSSGVPRRRWPILAVGLTCGVVAFSIYIYYESISDQVLNPTNFTSFSLVGKNSISSTSSIFTLQPTLTVENSRIYADACRKGVWSVQVKQPQLQIARAYTPLPPTDADESIPSGALRFLIRREPRGEVSGYLHRLPLGVTVELRGPHIEYEVPENVEEVLFIAGGTGIAPALQVAHTLFNCRGDLTRRNPKMHILWANRRREDSLGGVSDPPEVSKEASRSEERRAIDIVKGAKSPSIKHVIPSASPRAALVQQLDALKTKSPSNISVEYFVDEETTFITERLLKARLKNPRIADQKQQSKDQHPSGIKLVLVSGPDGFVKHYAGPKAWKNGQEVQGTLGGVLRDIIPDGWVVWKL